MRLAHDTAPRRLGGRVRLLSVIQPEDTFDEGQEPTWHMHRPQPAAVAALGRVILHQLDAKRLLNLLGGAGDGYGTLSGIDLQNI